MIAQLNLTSGVGTVIDWLATDHQSGGAGSGTSEDQKLCKLRLTQVDEFRELANVAVYGDPVHWPGLTAPAVDALGILLRKTSERGAGGKLFRAETMTNVIRAHRISLERFERLAPVLEGLAAILLNLRADEHGSPAALPMAKMLRSAPTEALAGPLQSLVQAFGQRIQDGKVSPEEQWVLEQIIAERVLDGQPVEAVRPVANAL